MSPRDAVRRPSTRPSWEFATRISCIATRFKTKHVPIVLCNNDNSKVQLDWTLRETNPLSSSSANKQSLLSSICFPLDQSRPNTGTTGRTKTRPADVFRRVSQGASRDDSPNRGAVVIFIIIFTCPHQPSQRYSQNVEPALK